MGDLNYRIDLELEDALYFIKIKDIQSLIVKDQLFIEISKGLDMDNFIEGKINFMPTLNMKLGLIIMKENLVGLIEFYTNQKKRMI